jgi:hypothetical protein
VEIERQPPATGEPVHRLRVGHRHEREHLREVHVLAAGYEVVARAGAQVVDQPRAREPCLPQLERQRLQRQPLRRRVELALVRDVPLELREALIQIAQPCG